MHPMQRFQSTASSSDPPGEPLAVGMKAPDFALRTTPDQRVSLSSFFGAPIVLVFYPADWSPVCGDQLALYNELHDEWRKHRAQLLGISVDSTWCHVAYAKDRRLRFPLLSDFEPKGDVARSYGVYVAPIGINPGAEGILEALEGLAKREETAHA